MQDLFCVHVISFCPKYYQAVFTLNFELVISLITAKTYWGIQFYMKTQSNQHYMQLQSRVSTPCSSLVLKMLLNKVKGWEILVSHFWMDKLKSTNTRQTWTHFNGGGCNIKPISHITMDPMIQHMKKKTTRPAKMVRNGGPGAASLVFVSSDPSEGFERDANTGLHLFFTCTLTSFLNLRENKKELAWIYLVEETPSVYLIMEPSVYEIEKT